MRAKSPGHELDGGMPASSSDYQAYPHLQATYSNYNNGYGGGDDYAHQYPVAHEPVGYGYTTQGPPHLGYSPGGGAGGYRAGSLPRGGGGGMVTGHSRKESTSFEHSEPLPMQQQQQRWPAAATRPPGPRQPYNPTEWVEMTVTLLRQDSGFGFRIVGGTEEGSQVRGDTR